MAGPPMRRRGLTGQARWGGVGWVVSKVTRGDVFSFGELWCAGGAAALDEVSPDAMPPVLAGELLVRANVSLACHPRTYSAITFTGVSTGLRGLMR
jgi:hypothetical protein